MSKIIAMGCDHGGPEFKNELKEYLESLGNTVIDCGIQPGEAVDYPEKAFEVASKVVSGEAELGILICGTGIGMSMAANKVKGIRAAACSEVYSAKLTRIHNNANMLCLGARVIGIETAKLMAEEFVNAEFELGGRHQRRVDLITKIEQTNSI